MPDTVETDIIVKAIAEGFDKAQKQFEAFGKSGELTAENITKLGGDFSLLGGNLDKLIAQFSAATPENMRYAKSIVEVQQAFNAGAISATDAVTAFQTIKAEMESNGMVIDKTADGATRLGQNYSTLDGQLNSLIQQYRASTPVNAAYAQSIENITKAFNEGKISSQEAADQLEKVRKEMEKSKTATSGMGEQVNKSTGFFKSLTSSLTPLNQGLELMKKIGEGIKKVYEFSKMGAEVKQTANSFKSLSEELSPTIDLMGKLEEASGYTIDKLTIQSSYLTLMAGATNELGSALSDATPQLMAIAKAANTLNPSLGDTAYMFESIATGIKRGSPMILDNLGLMINQTSANENYAASLGITADELTDVQKKIALLNEVLKTGNTLMEQAGTENQVDSYSRLETALKDLTDAMKANLHEGVEPLVSGAADLAVAQLKSRDVMALIEKADRLGISAKYDLWQMYYNLGKETKEGTKAQETYEAVVQDVADAEADAAMRNEDMALTQNDVNQMIADGTIIVGEQTQATKKLVKADEELERAVSAAAQASADHASMLERELDALEGVQDALYNGSSAADEYARRMDAAAYNVAVNREGLENLANTADVLFANGLISEDDIISANAKLGIEATLEELHGGIIDQAEALETLQDDFGLALEDAQGYLEGVNDPMQELTDLLGGLDATSLEDLNVSAADLADAFEIPLGVAQDILDVLNALNGKTVTSTVNVNTHYSYSGSTGNSGLGANVLPGGYTDYMKASGGPASGLTMVGEHGIELVNLPAGSYVNSNTGTTNILQSLASAIDNISGNPEIDYNRFGRAVAQAIRSTGA